MTSGGLSVYRNGELVDIDETHLAEQMAMGAWRSGGTKRTASQIAQVDGAIAAGDAMYNRADESDSPGSDEQRESGQFDELNQEMTFEEDDDDDGTYFHPYDKQGATFATRPPPPDVTQVDALTGRLADTCTADVDFLEANMHVMPASDDSDFETTSSPEACVVGAQSHLPGVTAGPSVSSSASGLRNGRGGGGRGIQLSSMFGDALGGVGVALKEDDQEYRGPGVDVQSGSLAAGGGTLDSGLVQDVLDSAPLSRKEKRRFRWAIAVQSRIASQLRAQAGPLARRLRNAFLVNAGRDNCTLCGQEDACDALVNMCACGKKRDKGRAHPRCAAVEVDAHPEWRGCCPDCGEAIRTKSLEDEAIAKLRRKALLAQLCVVAACITVVTMLSRAQESPGGERAGSLRGADGAAGASPQASVGDNSSEGVPGPGVRARQASGLSPVVVPLLIFVVMLSLRATVVLHEKRLDHMYAGL